MKRWIFIAILGGIFLFCSCDNGRNGALQITHDIPLQFRATYDGAPMLIGTTYTHEDGTNFYIDKFKFFVSNISFVKSEGGSIEATEVAFLDFETNNMTLADAMNGITVNARDVPTGTYSGIRMGIGVIADLNRTDPHEYGDTHPLSQFENYWPLWNTYIFSNLRCLADADGNGAFNQSVTLQAGFDEMYREISMAKNIDVEEMVIPDLNITIDVKKLISRGLNNYVDFTAAAGPPQENLDLMRFVMNNYENALSIY